MDKLYSSNSEYYSKNTNTYMIHKSTILNRTSFNKYSDISLKNYLKMCTSLVRHSLIINVKATTDFSTNLI